MMGKRQGEGVTIIIIFINFITFLYTKYKITDLF